MLVLDDAGYADSMDISIYLNGNGARIVGAAMR